MDRHDKLKLLKDEITRLFHERIDEEKVYEQLQTNPDFGSIVRRVDIHSFYEHLNKKDKIDAEDKKQIEAWENEEKQMMTNLECMKEYHQDSSKYWFYNEATNKMRRVMDIWQSRYLVTRESNSQLDVHEIKVLDMFQNVSKLFTIHGYGIFYRMHFLAFPFVLLHEVYGGIDYFHLLRFDFKCNSVKTVQLFTYQGNYFILTDQFDSSKFILKEMGGEMHNCKLLNGQIQIGDRFDIEWESTDFCTSYFNDKLYSLQLDRQNNITKISTYNLELMESKSFELGPFPEHLRFVDFEEDKLNYRGWIKDHFFTSVRFNLTNEYGIAFAEPKTCKWILVEFVAKIPIKLIQFADSKNLMVCANENDESSNSEIYKISMQKPDLLRNKAWITLIKKFKNDSKINDPYAEARRFLPFNSEIQQFIFFED